MRRAELPIANITTMHCVPPSSSGSLSGYATFQYNGRFSEYIFVEKSSSRRARTGKFAVAGSMEWRVLSRRHGCSLVEFKVDKCRFLSFQRGVSFNIPSRHINYQSTVYRQLHRSRSAPTRLITCLQTGIRYSG
ncbi:hypothetical protein ANCCAN_14732 [Ancylostoma caninum]|uniref:Uncharacterized protein n=1 Tax=Ancylostoma caninum TaxID=29170 RepID=A0A368G4F3_ANCCA|nr:hypothetical protein ANCCAN_14732 [Ancylostoma caninum]